MRSFGLREIHAGAAQNSACSDGARDEFVSASLRERALSPLAHKTKLRLRPAREREVRPVRFVGTDRRASIDAIEVAKHVHVVTPKAA